MEQQQTAQAAQQAAQKQLHPPFSVIVGVAHAFQFQQAKAGDVHTVAEPLVEHADGRVFKRTLVAAHQLLDTEDKAATVPVKVAFGPGAIDRELDEQEEARKVGAATPKRSFNQVVALHIEQLALRDHSPRDSWRTINATLPELEKFLQSYFELPGAPKTQETPKP